MIVYAGLSFRVSSLQVSPPPFPFPFPHPWPLFLFFPPLISSRLYPHLLSSPLAFPIPNRNQNGTQTNMAQKTALAAAAYVLHRIPSSLPHRLQEKISAQLAEMDYVHANATRVSSSVRKVLRFPADNLRLTLDRSVKELGERREDTLRVRGESEVALKYFGNLVRESAGQRDVVGEMDLENTPPGAAEFH